MIIFMIAVILGVVTLNIAFYEYRVTKNTDKLKTFDFTGEKWK